PYTVVLSGCISETIVVSTQNGSVTRSHTCTAPGSCTLTANITDVNGCVSAPCTATHVCIPCVPGIKVYKQVVCTDPAAACTAFSSDLNSQKSATGTSAVDANGDEHCSAFCYRITVVNTSQAGIELHNLQIVDTNFPGGVAVDLSKCLPNFP